MAPSPSVPEAVIQRIDSCADLSPTLVHAELLLGQDAVWADIPQRLHPDSKALLAARGRERVYSHQAVSIDLALSGHDVLVTTPTASGKSLCYQIPVLDSLLRDPQATGIYIAPTKALARDQWNELQHQVRLLPREASLKADQVVIYDGDVPTSERARLRDRARLLITNPDMLHSILPQHARGWGRFIAGLSHVAMDEIHYFRGLFGSHVGNVMRRLNRLHASLARRPLQYIAASATLANERQLAAQLFDRDVRVVDMSGAPSADRYVLFLNPAATYRAGAMRARTVTRYEQIFREAGLQSLIFCRSRNNMELSLDALREHALRCGLPPERVNEEIQGYRGGYQARQRRDIEAALREGRVRTVTTTNALEVGIDVGTVSCVVSVGYPGTVASIWQQWGRAGRAGRAALGVFLASGDDPMDQFIANNPDFLLERGMEFAHANPEHPELLKRHLPCALHEAGGIKIRPPNAHTPERGRLLWDVLGELQADGIVQSNGNNQFRFAGERRHLTFGLRDIGGSTRIVQQGRDGKDVVLGTVDTRAADSTVHKGAMYLHQGTHYRVLELDHDRHRALVVPAKDRVYTEAVRVGVVVELESLDTRLRENVRFHHGRVRVDSRVVGYHRYDLGEDSRRGGGKSRPNRMVELEDTRMVSYSTTAYWLKVPPRIAAWLDAQDLWHDRNSAEGLGCLLCRLAPLHLMCDPGDLGMHIAAATDECANTIYVHETFEGGLGRGESLFRLHDNLLAQASEAVAHCPCIHGCPACVGPSLPGRDDGPDRKTLVEALLEQLVSSLFTVDDAQAGLPYPAAC